MKQYSDPCRKKKHNSLFFVLAMAAIASLLLSCTDFFSTSWAAWAKRDPDKLIPAVEPGNVDELVAMAENDPDLSMSVLDKIRGAAKKAKGKDKQKLQEAAMEAAVNASGLGQSVLGQLAKLGDMENPEEGAKDLVLDTINQMSNLGGISAALLDILPDPDDPDFKDFTDLANANDLALAAMLLIAGEVKKQVSNGVDPDDYLENLITFQEPGENLAQALAIAAAISGREDELSGPLRDVLSGLKLVDK